MKKFARLNYDNFIIHGEVNERLPLYNEYVENIYPLENTKYNLNPDFQIKDGKVTQGSISKMISKQNVTSSNGAMNFNGSNTSYIELAGDVFGSDIIDIEFRFKLNTINKSHTIISSTPFTIAFDETSKRVYMTINGIKGQYSNVGDMAKNKYSLSDTGDIAANEWYRLRFYKYHRAVIVFFNDVRVRVFILDVDFNTTNSFLGKGLDGQIDSLDIRNESHLPITDITIPSKATSSEFSLCFNLKRNGTSYNIITIGSFILKLTNGELYANNTKLSDALNNDTLYGVSIGYINNKTKIIVYNMDTASIVVDKLIDGAVTSSNIITKTNIGIYNLYIYSKRLSDKILLEQYKRRFQLEKSGDIRYEVDEVHGHDKLKVSVGKKYHMQLTKDLSSDCGTININKKVIFVDGGIESKEPNRKIQLSFADKIGLPSTWHMIYKTKITKLTNGTHYDSLGEGLYWGIEDNKFIIKYINGKTIVTSFIDNLIANEVLNEWLVISVSYQSGVAKFIVCTSKGIFETTINKSITSISGSTCDLFLGGKGDSLYGEAIYRELNIISNWNVDKQYIENMFRTKFSYDNNKFISNVEIIEDE